MNKLAIRFFLFIALILFCLDFGVAEALVHTPGSNDWYWNYVSNNQGVMRIQNRDGVFGNFDINSFDAGNPIRGMLASVANAQTGELSEADLASIVRLLVDPRFIGSDPSFLAGLTASILDPNSTEYSEAVKQYISDNPEFLQLLYDYASQNIDTYKQQVNNLQNNTDNNTDPNQVVGSDPTSQKDITKLDSSDTADLTGTWYAQEYPRPEGYTDEQYKAYLRGQLKNDLMDNDAYGCFDQFADPGSLEPGSQSGNGNGDGDGTGEPVTPKAPVVSTQMAATQSRKDPDLTVDTDRPAICQYKKDTFNYGGGTNFSTTGGYGHSQTLTGLVNGNYVYYAVCKDNATGGVSGAFKVSFKVDLSLDPDNAPVITNNTPSQQTSTNPILEVKTELKATCQYKEDSDFEYGSGTALNASDGGKTHSVSIASLADKQYIFFVVCKDFETGAVNKPGKQITSTLNRSGDAANAPSITNTTNSTPDTLSPILSVKTTRNADCQYKKGSSFTWGGGTAFSTTGQLTHSAELGKLSVGQYTYYVVCKDQATNVANSQAVEIVFVLDASLDQANAPKVINTTSITQVKDPVLSVVTDRDAVCQYKEGSDFTYGSGTVITTSDNRGHNISISALADGSHDFYVVCQDKTTGAINKPGAKITTTINRGEAILLKINSTTYNYQITGSPILSVNTGEDADCQYKAGVSFSYGSGKSFDSTGSTSHSARLEGLSDGVHTYYVVCKKINANVTSDALQVVFVVNTNGSAGSCASLSSNDRRNDNNRSSLGSSSNDSVYLWQSVETGTREKFDKVDWYAGYQFTPQKDGMVTQLCAYFASGTANKVSLYNSSYSELANASISGTGKWSCLDINPVSVKADQRYYVIARVKDGPIFHEYKSGMLPKDVKNAVVEVGIRQLAGSNFGNGIVKYDYMVFGLVDAKISYIPVSTEGPSITSTNPSGSIYNSSTTIEAKTSEDSVCRFDRDDVDFDDMDYVLPRIALSSFSQKVCGLEKGPYTFYVRCKSKSGSEENNGSALVKFKIEQQ